MQSDKVTLGPNSEAPGLSSNTASVEALKMILSRAAKGRMKMWGLDISTAFLFANIVQPTVIELPGNFSWRVENLLTSSSIKLCTD